MLVVVASNKKYINNLLEKFEHKKMKSPKKTSLYKCIYEKHEFLIMKTGLGKVNISSSLRYICDFYKISLVLVVGTAGCICNNSSILDAVIAKSSLQFDVDFSPLGYKLSHVPKIDSCHFKTNDDVNNCLKNICLKRHIKYNYAIISSSDMFVSNYRLARSILNNFNSCTIDCETAVVGEFCYINKIQYSSLKIVSNYANNNASLDYKLYNNDAINICTDIIYEFIKKFYY